MHAKSIRAFAGFPVIDYQAVDNFTGTQAISSQKGNLYSLVDGAMHKATHGLLLFDFTGHCDATSQNTVCCVYHKQILLKTSELPN